MRILSLLQLHEKGCIAKTFFTPFDQKGKANKFGLHHSSTLKSDSELISSALATYVSRKLRF